MNVCIILASSRRGGNTEQLVTSFTHSYPAKVFNLVDLDISPFDYQHNNRDDDFFPLIEKILSYDLIIFVSPVYWYAMSAQLKVFFDRLTDLLALDKPSGRNFRNKLCAAIATGTDKSAPSCFEQPFALTASYFGMNYLGMLYCSCSENFNSNQHQAEITTFIDKIIPTLE